MTIGINQREPEAVLETLMHELTHRIFIQEGSREKTRKSWRRIREKYSKQGKITQTHIVCYALLNKLYLRFFDKKILQKEIERSGKRESYGEAWRIVKSEGYEQILIDFKANYHDWSLEAGCECHSAVSFFDYAPFGCFFAKWIF
ncbi:MAG: hypothetical protein U9O20_02735 [Patescibacteria group bacterium]|nr:hypothetical protein [Patescibacteria group bacterium]